MRALALLVVSLVLAACGSEPDFLCACDVEGGGVCRDPGTGGRYQGMSVALGACSYPEATCPSGHRYGDGPANEPIATTCVPVPR